MSQQLGSVYRYVRADADQDISGNLMQLSLSADPDGTWVEATYVHPGDWPSSVAAQQAADPPAEGFTAFWWRFYSGGTEQGIDLVLNHGYNVIHGRCVDLPELPYFSWQLAVKRDE